MSGDVNTLVKAHKNEDFIEANFNVEKVSRNRNAMRIESADMNAFSKHFSDRRCILSVLRYNFLTCVVLNHRLLIISCHEDYCR